MGSNVIIDQAANAPMNHLLAVMVGFDSPAYVEEFVRVNQASGALESLVLVASQVNSMTGDALISFIFERWQGFDLPVVTLLQMCRALPLQQLARLALAVRLKQIQPGLRMNSSYGAFLKPMRPQAGTPGAKAAKGH